MATHIKELLKCFFDENKKNLEERGKLEDIVNKVLSEKIRKHVCLKEAYKKKLVFLSDSSSFGYEFNLQREKLLQEIKKEFPLIETIQVKVG